MDERHVTGARGDAESDTGTSGLARGHAERVTTVENWTPPTDGGATTSVRRFLAPGESLHLVDPVTYLDEGGRPAVVGLTDDRLLLVAEDGGFLGVGLDRICSVRSDARTAHDVRGLDYRLLLAVGYLLAVVGLVGVLATAVNPLSPTLALVNVGSVLAAEHVARSGADLDPPLEALARHDGDTGLARRLRRVKRNLNRRADDADIALAATSGVAAVAFALVVAAEGGLATPFFTVLVVAAVGLTVYAFRYSDRFEGMELVRSRQRTVTATVEDGRTVSLRTGPDSTLARDIARLGQASRSERPADDAEA